MGYDIKITILGNILSSHIILFIQVKVLQHLCSNDTGMPGFVFSPERKEVVAGREFTLSPVPVRPDHSGGSPLAEGKDDLPLQAKTNHKT